MTADESSDSDTESHDESTDHDQIENTSTDSAKGNRTVTTKAVAGKVEPVQRAINDLEDDVPLDIFRRLDHSEEAIEAIEDWADNADPKDTDALVGAKIIIDAEQERAAALREEVPDGNIDLLRKFEEFEDRLEDLEDLVDSLKFTTTAYVVYVNSQFVARYDSSDVSVETMLTDAEKEDPDELGLFPLDGLTGNRQRDQAFPADEDLDLGGKNRTFFESTSDGGKIAHE
ncbi:hypothetical protein ACOZ4N_01225 (plasmid) [Halorientalis pallida]|uniref:hypothetical protein n=1 Tax=Halorientalis pallida TaxID=2479928 RepID=UPI003C6FFCBC